MLVTQYGGSIINALVPPEFDCKSLLFESQYFAALE